MGGTLVAKISPCPGPTRTLTISSPPEPNGGDHVAYISWPRKFNVSAFIGGSWVAAPTAFLFTSAGETYTLRATIPEEYKSLKAPPFPYSVVAMYAPPWAELEGYMTATVDDSACCVPEGESTGTGGIVYCNLCSNCGGSGTYPYPGCEPKFVEPLTIYRECACSATPRVDNWGQQNFPLTVYGWHDLEASWTLSLSDSQSCDSASGSGTVVAVITKTAGMDTVDVKVTSTSNLSGQVDTASTGHNYNNSPIATADIECSDVKITLSASFDISCSNGGANYSISYSIYAHNP